MIVSKGGLRLASATGTAQSPLVRESEMMTDLRISGRFAWTTSGSKLQVFDAVEYKLVCEIQLAPK